MPASSRFAVGVHVLAFLAHQGARPASSAEIAESVNTHPVVLRRLLASFVRAGFVKPRKGAAGGFSLVRSPADISLLSIYRAVENSPALGQPNNRPSARCPVGAGIPAVLDYVCAEAQRALEKQLGRITLAEAYRAACGSKSTSRNFKRTRVKSARTTRTRA